MVFALGLSAAFCLGLGFVLQQHAAQQAPPSELLRLQLLWHLMRKPIWLGGIASMVAGQVLGGIALGNADVALVEPILTTNLLFALAMSRIIFRVPMGTQEWAGAFLLFAGVSGFIAAGRPHGGDPGGGSLGSWLAVFVIGGVAVVLVAGAIHRDMRENVGSPAEKAMMLALAAGLLYGIQDGLTRHALTVLDREGAAAMFLGWSPYAVLGVGVISLLLAQSAFEAAPLRMSLPAITAAEPVAGIAVGMAVFGERVRLGPFEIAAEAACLAAMVIGVLIVGRSPLLDHSHHRFRERRAEAREHRAEAREHRAEPREHREEPREHRAEQRQEGPASHSHWPLRSRRLASRRVRAVGTAENKRKGDRW